ncbi:GNAT family N-acetyltransferase [Paraburkholderia sp. BL25I1N1]|uniref:GNAT family N-acetyltransferase n=1 Tax=Paraburkholderia sp. BL25I1N1 TaxID=1938804 RepID=UPI000D440DC0|nr:GNAT family N-acetyltransferase [Paraburkholderia sp. BL25I1N1]PRY04591.1 RimJ/RimL family protein N-acetyltransferase [Paraburkholderia sp. BL25I1N1]
MNETTYDQLHAIVSMHNIGTARMILRQPTSSDVGALFRIYGDPLTNEFNPAGPMRSLADAETTMARWLDHWIKNGFGTWAIAWAARPSEVVGFGGLSYRPFGDEVKVNLGYRLGVEAWGRGLATELATAAIKLGFQTPHLQEIFALVRSNHVASRNVLEKAGLTQFGTLDDVPGDAPSIVYRIAR